MASCLLTQRSCFPLSYVALCGLFPGLLAHEVHFVRGSPDQLAHRDSGSTAHLLRDELEYLSFRFPEAKRNERSLPISLCSPAARLAIVGADDEPIVRLRGNHRGLHPVGGFRFL